MPHCVILFFLAIGTVFAVVVFTRNYPRGLFDFVEGVIRWHDRVIVYALVLGTMSTHRFARPRTASDIRSW